MPSSVSREEFAQKQLRQQLPDSVEVPETVLRARNAGIPATIHLERTDVAPPLPLCRKKAGPRHWDETGLQRKSSSIFTSVTVCRDCITQVELSSGV